MAIIGIAAKRYAQALLEVAVSSGQEVRCLAELKRFSAEMNANQDLSSALLNPAFDASSQSSVVAKIAFKMRLSEITTNFLCLLALKRRLAQLPQIIEAYEMAQEQRAGIEKGEVITCALLTEMQLSRIRYALSADTGKRIVLSQRVDKDVIGGFKVVIRDRVYDFTIKSYFESLRNHLLAQR